MKFVVTGAGNVSKPLTGASETVGYQSCRVGRNRGKRRILVSWAPQRLSGGWDLPTCVLENLFQASDGVYLMAAIRAGSNESSRPSSTSPSFRRAIQDAACACRCSSEAMRASSRRGCAIQWHGLGEVVLNISLTDVTCLICRRAGYFYRTCFSRSCDQDRVMGTRSKFRKDVHGWSIPSTSPEAAADRSFPRIHGPFLQIYVVSGRELVRTRSPRGRQGDRHSRPQVGEIHANRLKDVSPEVRGQPWAPPTTMRKRVARARQRLGAKD